MRYINKYTTSGDVQTALENETLVKPYLAYITSEDKIDYNSQSLAPTPPSPTTPLTIEIVSAGTLTMGFRNYYGDPVNYSLDNGTTWVEVSVNEPASLNVNIGDTIIFKGDYGHTSWDGLFNMQSADTAYYNAYGNITSLEYGDNFSGQTASTCPFYDVFQDSNVIDASGLILPSTFETNAALNYLFNRCSNLTSVPALPATTLIQNCYQGMFAYCTSLTSAPALPATTLAEYCYEGMFRGCTSLTTAPALPATTLAEYCYEGMFRECTSLSAITCLATDISADRCTKNWVRDVSATGTFTKDSTMTGWTTGNDGIPSGWTVVDAS